MRLLSFPLIAVLVSALAVPFANAETKPKQTPPKTAEKMPKETRIALADADLKVLAERHHENLMEIELAKLALKQGTSKVKAFANTLVTDHTANDADLLALAKKRGATIPRYLPATDADKAKAREMHEHVTKLEALRGDDFDAAYVAMMVTGHEDAVARITAQLAATTDADVKMYLTMTKPTVELHAKRARDLQGSLTPRPGT